jgi:hypothetical protein
MNKTSNWRLNFGILKNMLPLALVALYGSKEKLLVSGYPVLFPMNLLTDMTVISSYASPDRTDSGIVYRYDLHRNRGWELTNSIGSSLNVTAQDLFGYSFLFDGKDIIIAAPCMSNMPGYILETTLPREKGGKAKKGKGRPIDVIAAAAQKIEVEPHYRQSKTSTAEIGAIVAVIGVIVAGVGLFVWGGSLKLTEKQPLLSKL